MKNILILTLSLVFVAACSHTTKTSSIKAPDFQEFTLSNGLKVVVAKNSKLPLVSATLMIYPGASTDPKGKTGLTYLMAELMEKGTKNKSAEEVAEAFAQLGTSFTEITQSDYMLFGTESLKQNEEKLLQLFTEVLLEPQFSPKEFSMLKKRLIASIQKSFDDPRGVADYVYEKSLMNDYVYARPTEGTLEDVQKISLKEVKSQYEKLFNTRQATLVLSGDWSEEAIKSVETLMSPWKVNSNAQQGIAVSTNFPEVKPELLLVTKPGLKQAQIRLGHKGIKRNNEDYWSLQVANVILGGNFSSRLMNEVRVKRGLTYTINSSFSPALFEGPYTISTFTRFDKIKETIETTRSVVHEFKDKGVTEEEVNRAKNYLKGHLIRSFENPEDVVMTILRMRIYGLPKEEVTQVIEKVNAVNLGAVNASIKKYYQPDSMMTVIYAPDSMKKELDSLGKLQVKKASDYLLN